MENGDVRMNKVHVSQWNFLEHFTHLRALFQARHDDDTPTLKQLPPVTVEIDPVDYCNHSCEWCFTASHRETDRMSDDAVTSLVRYLGDQGVKSVHFAGGGESTLLKRFARLKSDAAVDAMHSDPTLLDVVNRAGMVAGLITNGSTLRILDLDHLSANTSWIRFSIDAGTEQRYRVKHRPKGHGLADIHRGIEELVSARGNCPYPTIGASFIFERNTPDIVEEIRAFVRTMVALKIDYVQIKPENLNRGPESQEFLDDIGSVLEEELSGSTTFATVNLPHVEADNAKYCWYSHIGPVVGATGDVYACCYTYGLPDFKLGNILESDAGFGRVWASSERLRVSERIEPSKCTSCRHTSFNQIADRLYDLGEEAWDWLADQLRQIEDGKSEETITYPASVEWLRPGLEQYESLRKAGQNSITAYPVYRSTNFINASAGP